MSALPGVGGACPHVAGETNQLEDNPAGRQSQRGSSPAANEQDHPHLNPFNTINVARSCTLEHMFDLTRLAAVDPQADEAALVEQIAELERVKSAAAAGQARAAAALDQRRRRDEAAAGVLAAARGRGVASEIGLARHDSPARGAGHLQVANTLVHDMRHTLAALETGALSEWRATLIAREAADLSAANRRVLDAELCADPSKLEGMGDKRITAEAKRIAHRLDDRAAAERSAKSAAERRVTFRPAPNAMAWVSVFLP